MWLQTAFVYFIKCFWFIAPFGFANMAPTFVRNTFKFLDKPVDGGKLLWGQPLFGRTKTWRGLLIAPIFGEISFVMLAGFCQFPNFKDFVFFDYSQFPIWLGFVFGAGAIIGDLAKSFVKRRFKHESSARWFPFDNIDYLLGGFLVIVWFIDIAWYHYLAVLLIGLALHIIFNLIGYGLRIKKVPW